MLKTKELSGSLLLLPGPRNAGLITLARVHESVASSKTFLVAVNVCITWFGILFVRDARRRTGLVSLRRAQMMAAYLEGVESILCSSPRCAWGLLRCPLFSRHRARGAPGWQYTLGMAIIHLMSPSRDGFVSESLAFSVALVPLERPMPQSEYKVTPAVGPVIFAWPVVHICEFSPAGLPYPASVAGTHPRSPPHEC